MAAKTLADETFYPNACHVCNKYGKEVSLKICGHCRMISYCSKEHQDKHRPEHETICKAIKDVLGKKKYMNTKEISMKNWTYKKIKYIEAVSIKIKRNMTSMEAEMFLFPRACVVCHRQNGLINCNNCPCVSFCNEHRNHSEHTSHCKTLKLCFKMDHMDVMSPREFQLLQIFGRCPRNMTYCLDKCMPSGRRDIPPQYMKMYYSQYLTRPMTLYFVLKKLKFRSRNRGKLVVHHIATFPYKKFAQWELLLHITSSLTSLTIINIGPDLSHVDYEIAKLCDNCVRANKTIVHEYYPAFYRDYVRKAVFKRPDIIIGWNVLPYAIYDKSDSTIIENLSEECIASAQAIMERNCPYILTFNELPAIKKEKIKEFGIYGKNPYSGLRPYRSILNEKPYYSNQRIIIFEKIENSLILVQETVDGVDPRKFLLRT